MKMFLLCLMYFLSVDAYSADVLVSARFPVISWKGTTVVVEDPVSKLSVGDVVYLSGGVLSAKVTVIKNNLAVIVADRDYAGKAGDMFTKEIDAKTKRQIDADALIAANVAPVPSPTPVTTVVPDAPEISKISEITTIRYLPRAGKFYVEGMLMPYSRSTVAVSGSTGGSLQSTQIIRSDSNLSFGYALTDDFTLGFQEALLIKNEEETTVTATGIKNKFNREGLSDPAIGFYWRYENKIEKGAAGKLRFSVSPGLLKNIPSNKIESGNNGRGATLISLRNDSSWLRDKHEWSSAAEIIYSSKQKTEGSTFVDDAIFQSVLEVAYRYHPTPKFFLEPRLLFSLPYSSRETSGTDSTTIDIPLYVTLSYKVGYAFTEKVLMYIGLSSTRYTADVRVNSAGTISTATAEVLGFAATAGLQWEL